MLKNSTLQFLASNLVHAVTDVRCYRADIMVAHLHSMHKLEENAHEIALTEAVYAASPQSPLTLQNRHRLQLWYRWALAAAFKLAVENALGWEDLFMPPKGLDDDADAAPEVFPAPRLSNRPLNAAVSTRCGRALSGPQPRRT